MIHTETAFESAIEEHLLAHGYEKVPSRAFDKDRALFPQAVLDFIRATQPREWTKLEAIHHEKTGDVVLADLCRMLDSFGCLAVLRQGFKCYGQTLRVAFFRAAHKLNPDLEARYTANRLGLTRQLRYSANHNNELDLTLSLNGVPLFTAELKNPLTHSTVEEAVSQYRTSRDPRERLFEFKKRALVHFAVDSEVVFMTTRLAGDATVFLPFNKGNAGGAGNPSDPSGRTYRTAYLWEEVWARESVLDILSRFIHLQVEDKRTPEGRKVRRETMIFPRYHQLQAVRTLEEAARKEGPGHNYLIEHSAGSGKSNTIGWLAHRLASLHNEEDTRVFDSVIVITDRRVLDRQLQDTIYQFEHRQGVVRKIDTDSRQLAEALESGVPIIITTLQKFPFVSQQLIKMAEERGETNTPAASGLLTRRHFAVIVDEAHSSQSGQSAADLKEVLGGEELHEAAQKAAREEGREDMAALFRDMAKRGRQSNLSFFAFTATPKHKTLAVFSHDGDWRYRYTMRQAIEEGFIMDVLKSYTTYAVYHGLLKTSADDPNVERKKAARTLANFTKMHPYSIAQKTVIMVEHFNGVSRHKIGGKAKAMVVTDSRLAAVRYKQSFDGYIKKRGYTWLKTLVAFSGVVDDDKVPSKTYTEEGMNCGIKETELPEKFDTAEYQVLLVADKYQTGFDQPLLHTMYVDKRLAGIQAVQTLSRLNRIHPLKEDTFVLDFVNDRQEIFEAFKPFYEGVQMGAAVEPSRLYEVKAQLDAAELYYDEEIEAFCRVFFKPKAKQSAADHSTINAALDPAVDRFKKLRGINEDEAELLRTQVTAFINLYGYLSQIIPFQDSDLERIYSFLRFLLPKLPQNHANPSYIFDDEVRLEYYRIQKISEGSIALNNGQALPLRGPQETGTGQNRAEEVPLSQLIQIINDRFGTDFTRADGLFFDQILEVAAQDESLQNAARANPHDKFQLVFEQALETLFAERMEQNEDLFARFMNESDFRRTVSEELGRQVFEKLIKS